MRYTVKVKADGTLEFLGQPPPGLNLPMLKPRRISEIIPINPVKRSMFRLLRKVFGEYGLVGQWTRTWRCQWRCTLLAGKHTGFTAVSTDRASLIDWEQKLWRKG